MMPDNKDYTILVVDDSTTNVVLLEAILDEKGYKIETALNAKEAYSIIEKNTPDLILLDLLMPKISGFDFLQEIRKNDNTKSTPVIVVSALTDEENIEKIMNMGAIDFVKKPIDLQYLVDKVESVLQQDAKMTK
ncbi:MAG: response regulator [Bacteroidales bacterium]|nr:response regulator [Bacteroidales bacterium]MBN2820169.1 response regulator [Bacteroidales bacterium]